MKLFVAILTASLFISAGDAPSKLQYDEIIIYDFNENSHGEGGSIVDDKGRLAPVIKQVLLDKATATELHKRIFQKSSYGAPEAACFDPHLGIVYYLNKKIVAHFTICMGCNRLEGSVEIPAQLQVKGGTGKEIYYTGMGMSKSFRKFLNGLLVKHKFSHQGDE